MFKLVSIAAVVALLCACSGMSGGSMTGSSGMSDSTTMGSSGTMPGSTSSTTNNGDGPN
ncbi:MAG: hypothetical protein LH617_14500 [Ramlibacter sp.]|nr:hypothetical protein [Ramlibacter sp.]